LTGANGLLLIVSFGMGYMLGAVPFGLLLTRAAGLGDIRKIGSGNIGATNVLRTGNKWLAAATLLLDVLKGSLAVIAGGVLQGMQAKFGPADPVLFGAVSGLGAFLGHLYPVWLGFRGGKGVATYIGVLLGLMPSLALVFCGIWLSVAVITRYSSLSALVAATATPFAAFYWGGPILGTVTLVMSGLLIYRHQPNIERLMAGKESRIGGKAES
jgi:acyl phosphate:glycerol-3-phosphate acyltransferase